MKNRGIILACLLICLSLFTGCMDGKNGNHSSTDSGNAVEVDMGVVEKGNTNIPLDGDIDFEFKDPEDADSIEIMPKED